MEVLQERLEREYDIDLINTSPSVIYRVETTKGEVLHIHSPSQLPKTQEVASIAEPIARLTLHLPDTLCWACTESFVKIVEVHK